MSGIRLALRLCAVDAIWVQHILQRHHAFQLVNAGAGDDGQEMPPSLGGLFRFPVSWWREAGSNCRPTGYESVALTI